MLIERAERVTLVGLGAVFLALGAWAAVDAASFAGTIANFGPPNPHLVHDFAAASATFGIGLLIASRAAAWRTPALALAAIWTGLHAVSHLVDIGAAHPAAMGPIEAGLLLVVTAVLAGLAVRSAKEETA